MASDPPRKQGDIVTIVPGKKPGTYDRVYESWAGVANPFNSCSRYTACSDTVAPPAARAPDVPAKTNQVDAAAAARREAERQNSLAVMRQQADTFNDPQRTRIQQLQGFADGLAQAEAYEKKFGPEGLTGPFQSGTRQQLARQLTNSFIDGNFVALRTPPENTPEGLQARFETLATIGKLTTYLDQNKIQDQNTTLSRIGTTPADMTRELDRLQREILGKTAAISLDGLKVAEGPKESPSAFRSPREASALARPPEA